MGVCVRDPPETRICHEVVSPDSPVLLPLSLCSVFGGPRRRASLGASPALLTVRNSRLDALLLSVAIRVRCRETATGRHRIYRRRDLRSPHWVLLDLCLISPHFHIFG